MESRLEIRLSEGEKVSLQREASDSGVTLSNLVRSRLFGISPEDDERLDDHERRLARLEEMAGL